MGDGLAMSIWSWWICECRIHLRDDGCQLRGGLQVLGNHVTAAELGLKCSFELLLDVCLGTGGLVKIVVLEEVQSVQKFSNTSEKESALRPLPTSNVMHSASH